MPLKKLGEVINFFVDKFRLDIESNWKQFLLGRMKPNGGGDVGVV